MQVYVTAIGGGKEAITRYHLLHSNGHYSLLELDLETGRKTRYVSRWSLSDTQLPAIISTAPKQILPDG